MEINLTNEDPLKDMGKVEVIDYQKLFKKMPEGPYPNLNKLLKLKSNPMNEVYTDHERKGIMDRIREALSTASRELGIRNTNDNITITVSCSDKEIERISKEVMEEAERIGILTKVGYEPDQDPNKIRVTSYQTPLGKLILIPNGK